jgi:ABC-2 type transport system permease protein
MQISLQRIWALTLRYFYTYASDFWKAINTVYWSSIEILIWVNVGKWLQSTSDFSITQFFLLSAIVWMPFTRAAYDISLATLKEIYTSNLCNLFSSPLEFKEWVISLVLFSSVVNVLTIAYSFLFIYMFYNINLFSLYIFPLMLIVFFSGVSLGFFASGLIIFFGLKIEELIYMFPWSLVPFSGVYYSLNTLPNWMQYVGCCLPMSYIFTYLHAVIQNKPANFNLICISIILTFFYLIISLLFFNYMFNKSKDLGLFRLN